MHGKFQSIPKSMFPMLNSMSGLPIRVISRTARQAGTGYRGKNSTNVGLVVILTGGINKRFAAATKVLGTTKATTARALIHAALPKLEKLAGSVEKPVKKLCPACGCK